MENHQIELNQFENNLLTVSPPPHIKSSVTTRTIMLDVAAALTPALLWAVYLFGFRALTITVISVLACVLFEALFRVIMKRPQTVLDFSAVVTGMLLAYNLPATVSLWIPVVGAFFAIIVVKQLFGGIGMNIMNPALAARVFLFSWPAQMTVYPNPSVQLPVFSLSVNMPDMIASATPLTVLKQGNSPESVSILDLILGNCPGVIGEVSAFILTGGAVYLLVKKIITWHIPAAYIGTVAVLSYVLKPTASSAIDYMLYQIFSGGLFLGAIFMATDYTTSPVTKKGRLIYGFGCGLITFIIRRYSGYAGGVSFAILIMNCFVWYIDSYTKPTVFGYTKPETPKPQPPVPKPAPITEPSVTAADAKIESTESKESTDPTDHDDADKEKTQNDG